uniref:Uncharacterized protein n=1 Tax=Macrostomum lignano TaxID=282301 RepID=A0A1I8FDN5_9PLAT
RGVYVTERGQNIDKKPNETYVSCDQMKSWIPWLSLFSRMSPTGRHGAGRNEECIRLITKDLSYLTWERLTWACPSESLPHSFRAKYCEIVI